MSIVKIEPDIDPRCLEKGQKIKVFSDAPDNLHAILDIVRWTADYGLWKDKETHLPYDGSLRWGWCFRPTDEEIQGRLDASERLSRRVENMGMTRPSHEILEDEW